MICNLNYRFLISSFYIFYIIIHDCFCQDFGYTGDIGPTHWGEKYSSCLGKHQSPIDISEQNITIVHFESLQFQNFDKRATAIYLTNTGHTVVVKFQFFETPKISGGPLVGTYVFEQLHFHWGKNDQEGSENKINNSSFPLESHMLFFNEKYINLSNATQHPDGLLVLALLFKVENKPHENYDNILKAVNNVQFSNTNTTIISNITLKSLLTTNVKSYYTYDGSLTTPPCSEVVTWIQFKKPIGLSHEQLTSFRNLYNGKSKITINFRPIQPLYDRLVYYSDDNYDDSNNNDNKILANKSNQKINVNSVFIILMFLFCNL